MLRKTRHLSHRLGRLCPGDSAGNMAIEAAVVAPILILLMIGLVDFALALRAQMSLDGAARAGAQVGVLGRVDEDTITQVVREALGMPPEAGPGETLVTEITLHCYCPVSEEVIACNATCDDGSQLERGLIVRVQDQHTTLFGYPWIGKHVQLAGRAEFRLP